MSLDDLAWEFFRGCDVLDLDEQVAIWRLTVERGIWFTEDERTMVPAGTLLLVTQHEDDGKENADGFFEKHEPHMKVIDELEARCVILKHTGP